LNTAILASLVFGVILLGFSFDDAYGELSANNAFLVEGSGFAVTADSIKTSQIDMAISTGNQAGSNTKIIVEDGFVTLDDDDFLITDFEGTGLREGRFLRISGTAENLDGDEISVRFFGRLIENSQEGSIYSFTGRLIDGDVSHKIVYTIKLSEFGSTPISSTTSEADESNEIVIHIKEGAGNVENLTYIDVGQPIRASPYTVDRIAIEPGATITWINDDTVSHSISSGSGLGSSNRASQGAVVICDEEESPIETRIGDDHSGVSFRANNCTFTLDGRINSGEILPGESWSVTIEEPGFYRLADIDYIYMTSVIYAFPNIDSIIIGTPGEDFN